MGGARLGWGIRGGFRDYLDGLTDLRTRLVDVEFDAENERWEFPLDREGASLHLTAHGGALRVAIVDPRVVLAGEQWLLVHDGGTALARLLDGDAGRSAGIFRDVALTVEGSVLFGGVYAPWARMDPVVLLDDDEIH